jgi:hypothetical protein
VTPAELPGRLRRLAQDVQDRAALDAADSMAQAYQRAVVKSMKGYGDDPSPPGTPPARKTGTLARSVRPEPARQAGAGRAASSVAPHTVYARIQQLGGTIRPVRAKRLHWKDSHGNHYAMSVYLPRRPYMVMTSSRREDCRAAAIAAVQRVVREALGG